MKSEEGSGRKPLDLASAKVPRGQVYVIPGRCKGCGYCIEFCPNEVLAESEDINAKGYRYPVVKRDDGYYCIHCQFCNLVCPEMAIYTEEIGEGEGKEASGERNADEA